MTDRKRITSLSTATKHFGPFRGRSDHKDDIDLMEEIYVGLYKDGGPTKGGVFFISAEHELGAREVPPPAIRLTFEDVKKELVARFKRRNRKLKVTGMP